MVDVAVSDEERLQARNDLAWAIAAGGVGTVLFASLLAFAWFFAATLFLIFAGILLAVALNATTSQLGRFIALPHPVRLGMVCVVLAALFSGVIFLGGATIANESAALSDTIKSQLVNVKAFLDKNGIDTSYFEFGSGQPEAGGARGRGSPVQARSPQAAARS